MKHFQGALVLGCAAAVSRIGNGAVVLNTLRIRENLDGHPAAGRILLNIVRHARTLPETGKAPVQNAEALLEELRRRWRTPVVPENSSS